MTLQNKLDTEEDLKHTTLFISHGRIRPTANVGCWRMNKQYKNTSKILHITTVKILKNLAPRLEYLTLTWNN